MIRQAGRSDLIAIKACVDAAFRPYVQAIGRSPAPMLADHALLVERGSIHLLEIAGALLGVIVLEPCPDHLFVETLAVPPEHQRRGAGRRLMAFAEDEADRLGLPEIRLYTNEAMAGSLAFYRTLGFDERERGAEDGYARIYLVRRLPLPSVGRS
ncbi:MAG: GNAT family N-acetyltransferase [Geminicoccaceae bacterium]|nr:GNAT family N-acetyltransferase [Geminicoccaceae bacterium]